MKIRYLKTKKNIKNKDKVKYENKRKGKDATQLDEALEKSIKMKEKEKFTHE